MGTLESRETRSGICPSCGTPESEGLNCESQFQAALVQDFSDHRYAKVHRLLTDAYALQHPEEYMRSSKSFAAHLTGMCAALERKDATQTNQAVQRWLTGSRSINRPTELPKSRGRLNIAHLERAKDSQEHVRLVKEWAHSVWLAWSEHHGLAREWIKEAVRSGRSL